VYLSAAKWEKQQAKKLTARFETISFVVDWLIQFWFRQLAGLQFHSDVSEKRAALVVK
jgi:hypothetical protein